MLGLDQTQTQTQIIIPKLTVQSPSLNNSQNLYSSNIEQNKEMYQEKHLENFDKFEYFEHSINNESQITHDNQQREIQLESEQEIKLESERVVRIN